MSQGWIKLHRVLLDNPRAKDPDWLAVWIYFLLHATHTDHDALFDGKIVTLRPGQLITGRLKISEATGVQESKVKRLLVLMKTDQQIDQHAGSKSSIITVLNWSFYQGSDQQIDRQVTSDRPADDQQVTTIQEGKKERMEAPTPGARLHGIPSSVDEVIAYGLSIHPVVNEAACRRFWAHYEGQRGTNASGAVFWKTSGDAVVTNWKAKLPQFGEEKSNGTHQRSNGAGIDRNAGTANEGKANQYASIGKV